MKIEPVRGVVRTAYPAGGGRMMSVVEVKLRLGTPGVFVPTDSESIEAMREKVVEVGAGMRVSTMDDCRMLADEILAAIGITEVPA